VAEILAKAAKQNTAPARKARARSRIREVKIGKKPEKGG
jgi:hypothetical protein